VSSYNDTPESCSNCVHWEPMIDKTGEEEELGGVGLCIISSSPVKVGYKRAISVITVPVHWCNNYKRKFYETLSIDLA